MKRSIIIIILCVTILSTLAGCSKATAGIDTTGPLFSEFEFGMSKSTVRSIYPEWETPIINTDQVMYFEEEDYKGFHGSIIFAFDIEGDHTLKQINLYFLPKEENTREKYDETVAMFNDMYGKPVESVDYYYAYWTFKYGEDDAVLLIVYDEGWGDIQTYLMYEYEFPSLYELL